MHSVAIITGPTASGKSEAALRSAQALGGSIINADSVSVYKGFDVGSSKPDPAALLLVPHFLVSSHEPTDEFNAGVFCSEADAAVREIYAAGSVPLVVGGTGLYIRSLLNGLVESGEIRPEAREAVERRTAELLEKHGGDRAQVSRALHQWLSELDPETAGGLHDQDRARVMRALLVLLSGGRSLAELQEQHRAQMAPRYRALIVALLPERSELYRRIDRRVDEMLAAGLIEETRSLLARYPRSSRAFGAIGYSHAVRHISGELGRDEMRREMQRDTRRFAKRQLTWWRNQPGRLGWRQEAAELPAAAPARAEFITDRLARFFSARQAVSDAAEIEYLALSEG